MIAHLADAPVSKVDNFFVPDAGYATPKVDLRAGIIQEGKILLVRERSDGKWTLPGGVGRCKREPKGWNCQRGF